MLDLEQVETGDRDKEIILKLIKPVAEQEKIKSQLSKYKFYDNRLYAVEKTLGAVSDAFVYQASITEFHQSEPHLAPTP